MPVVVSAEDKRAPNLYFLDAVSHLCHEQAQIGNGGSCDMQDPTAKLGQTGFYFIVTLVSCDLPS